MGLTVKSDQTRKYHYCVNFYLCYSFVLNKMCLNEGSSKTPVSGIVIFTVITFFS